MSHHLSVGEKKRIAIATVLSMQPEILVLDEPTAGLRPARRGSLIHLLDELEMTMLVSTHDMLLVNELFPRMVVMDEGGSSPTGRPRCSCKIRLCWKRTGWRGLAGRVDFFSPGSVHIRADICRAQRTQRSALSVFSQGRSRSSRPK